MKRRCTRAELATVYGRLGDRTFGRKTFGRHRRDDWH